MRLQKALRLGFSEEKVSRVLSIKSKSRLDFGFLVAGNKKYRGQFWRANESMMNELENLKRYPHFSRMSLHI